MDTGRLLKELYAERRWLRDLVASLEDVERTRAHRSSGWLPASRKAPGRARNLLVFPKKYPPRAPAA